MAVKDLNKLADATAAGASGYSTRRAFYAVYDGHGGSRCSQFLEQTLHLNVARHPQFFVDPQRALLEAWASTDAQFQAMCVGESGRREVERAGSTAVVCLIVGNTLYTCNCGDSSAVLLGSGAGEVTNGDEGAKNGSARSDSAGPQKQRRSSSSAAPAPCAISLTVEHGTVVHGRFPHCCRTRVVSYGKPRLFPGGLLVTRSFGDLHAKLASLGGNARAFTSEPALVVRTLDAATDVGLLLMSDGVSDAMDPQAVAKTCRDALANHFDFGEADPVKCVADCVVQSAVTHKSWRRKGFAPDNTTAVFVKLG